MARDETAPERPREPPTARNPMIETLVQYTHLDKEYFYLPGMSAAAQAGLLGLDEAAYAALKARFDANAHEAAQGLLGEPAFAGPVDRLPFAAGETVLALGDSLTDDLQSWFEILRHVFELQRPDNGITFINEGKSAHTTGMILRRLVPTLTQHQPDWIICCLGGNDVTRVGPEPNVTQVSLQESARNLRELQRITTALTDARWIWMTPVPVNDERVAAFPPFKMGLSSWRNADINALSEVMLGFPEPVVDLQQVFGIPADPDLQGPDGVHPTLAGQAAITRALVERMAM